MSRNSFILLFILTTISVIAAIFITITNNRPNTVVGDMKPVFPNLVKEINNVGAIEIYDSKNRFTIIGEGDRWGILEKGNYVVPRERVRNFLIELSNLKLVEKKTKISSLYNRLAVENPTEKNSASRGVRILSTNGDKLASGIIGKRKYFLYVDGRGGTYVRKEEDDQSWLAEGGVNFKADAPFWLNRLVFELDPNYVQSYEISEQGGEKLVANRKDPGKKFEIESIAKDRIFKTDNEAERLTYVIEKFEFADIEKSPHNKFDNFDGKKHFARYNFFNGLVITFEVITIPRSENDSKFDEPKRWARIRASLNDKASLDQKNKIQKVVDELNNKLSPWDFLLEELDGIRTTKKIEDMLKEKSS